MISQPTPSASSSSLGAQSSSSGSGDAVALRLASFIDTFKGGLMDDSRRLQGISRLLESADDIRRATSQDLSAALRVLRMSKLGATDRERVLRILSQERSKLIEAVGQEDGEDHTEDDEVHQQEDEDGVEEAQSQ